MTRSDANTEGGVSTQTPGASAAGATGVEHLSRLHKMSTTAGLGTQEYVAVNVTAIVAALFGLGSLLAKLGDVLLVVPVTGVILAIVALKQIRNSNGTQTGRWLAWLGLILSGVITAALFGSRAIAAWQTHSDEQAMAAICRQFGELVRDEKYSEAYDLFDADFKSRTPADVFKGRLWALQHRTLLPPIDATDWNGNMSFETKPSGVVYATTFLKVHYKGVANLDRFEMFFRKSGNTWEIDHIPTMFPPPTQTAAMQ
jgi:hypothetical protein